MSIFSCKIRVSYETVRFWESSVQISMRQILSREDLICRNMHRKLQKRSEEHLMFSLTDHRSHNGQHPPAEWELVHFNRLDIGERSSHVRYRREGSRYQSINQPINQTSIAPVSPAKPGSVARQPNQCSTAKSRKQFRNINRQWGVTVCMGERLNQRDVSSDISWR